MNKYLVTGGAGFIGANLVQNLVKNNKKVFLIVEKNSNLWRLQNILSSIIIYESSLTEFEKINFFIKKIRPNVIYHLASYGGFYFQQDQKKIFDVNFYGTINLLNSCKKIGFDCFVNTGSSSEYGIKDSKMKEDDVLLPVSDYGVSKAATTQFCLKEALFNKLPVYTLRPFSVYGDYEADGRLISSILINALKEQDINLSSPNFVRDFIYIKDFIDSYIKISELKPTGEYIFNIGSGEQFSIGDVVTIIKSLLDGLKFNWGETISRPWEPKVWEASVERAQKILKWNPKYSLKDGLKKSMEWFAKNLYLYEKDIIKKTTNRIKKISL